MIVVLLVLFFIRMRKYLLFILLFASGLVIHAGNLPRSILWTREVVQIQDSGSWQWPDFLSSVHENKFSPPRYQEIIPVDGNISELRLVNLVFAPSGVIGDEIGEIVGSEISLTQNRFFASGEQFIQIELIPFIKQGNQLLRLVSFNIEWDENALALKSATTKKDWSSHSVLASGKWVKIKTGGRGICKILYDDLKSWGFANPSEVKLYGNGGFQLPLMNNESFFDDLRQNAVFHAKDGSGKDCIFFYSTGTVKWSYSSELKMIAPQQNAFSDDCFYYLSDAGSMLPVVEQSNSSLSATKVISEFDFYSRHEKDEINFIHSGARWFGDRILSGQEKVFVASLFGVPSRIESEPLKIHVDAVGRGASSTKLNVFANNLLVGNIDFFGLSLTDPESAYVRPGFLRAEKVLSGSSIDIKLGYSAGGESAWIDRITLNARCRLQFAGGQFDFRDLQNISPGAVTAYIIDQAPADIQVWDVSDFTRPQKMTGELVGNGFRFVVETDRLREFVAFNPKGNIPTVEKVGDIQNQDLHGATVSELLIVAPEEFLPQAEELAAFHREQDAMSVLVVSPRQIYNEFSGGQADAAGIRNFIRMCYEKSDSKDAIKYVLLLGDGSFDNKNIRGSGFNKIPTYQSDDSFSPLTSFVSDDFFVLLDDNEGGHTGLVDLGIGRIPARTAEEADAVVQKIKNYVATQSLGNWRNIVCLIGDDGNIADGYTNQHMEQSEAIADQIANNHPAFYADKIYFDAFRRESGSGSASYPEVEQAINQRVKDGVLILNYIGHANDEFLADERVLDINKIAAWSNYKNLPIFVTATCEFSRFDEDDLSAGEHILFNPNGGGIGLFSTTRLVYSLPNFNLTKSFYNHVFGKDEAGKNLRMGDIMRLAKVGSNTGTNKRNFTLLADPALRLAYPQLQVKTETINGQPASDSEVTISALNKVTVSGSVTDYQGNIQSDFNGTVIPVVYDKAMEVETMGNAGQNTMTFDVRDNVIYKGKVSVTNGAFSFSFVVPKDISYSINNGKIMYYADNGKIDAHGAFSNFLIGGSSGTQISDNQGPEIKLYINNNSFKSGDKVGASPILIAEVSDENGINTVGTGIGHDITAVLDGDNSNRFVLNSYYESTLDSHTSGKIAFPLNNLQPGKHTITLKVWDVLNNSSEATVEFVVTSDFSISELKCYPNPTTDYIYFSAVHNLPDELFSATIELFDRNGRRIAQIEKQLPSEGAQTIPLKWQASDSGLVMAPGVYLIRLNLTSQKGYTGARTEKFIFIRK